MYLEVYSKGNLIRRITEILGGVNFSNELMYTPSMNLTLPITYREFFSGREEIKLFVNDKCFWGIVLRVTENKVDETLELGIEHVIREWTYRQISVNNSIKDKTINVVFKEEDEGQGDPTVQDQIDHIYADKNFAYPGWRMNYGGDAGSRNIDYVYSRQNKLEALTKTVELTPDLFWRVRFVDEKVVDVSTFGEQKQWIISLKQSGPNNIRLIEEPSIEHDLENVVNLATVYSEKSDSGMSSMTLREVYNDPTLQIDGFPCVILRANVNNDRDYRMYTTQFPKLAPNNEIEYAIIDEESVAMEGGHLIEGTYAFNDLAPFNPELDDKTQEITDADRIKAAKTAYEAAVKKLKDARRRYKITLTTEELPAEIAPGDKVRFLYDNSLYILEECSAYMKKILSYNDWFYVTAIDYEIDETGVETNRITLEKYLHIERKTDNQ